MEELLQQIEGYKKEIEDYSISSAQELEEFRIKYLGTKGLVKNLFGEMRHVPAERKKEFGQVLNDFKQFAEAKFENAKGLSNGHPSLSGEQLDLSLPGDAISIGARHPVTLVRNRMVSIFQRLGFSLQDPPSRKER